MRPKKKKKKIQAAEIVTEKAALAKKAIDDKPVITEEVKVPAKAVEEKKSAPSKATEKTSAPKKETKSAPSKKPTEPTINIELQYAGKAIPYDEIVKKAKEATGGKDNINIYVKPEENRVYYVAGSDVGSFEI